METEKKNKKKNFLSLIVVFIVLLGIIFDCAYKGWVSLPYWDEFIDRCTYFKRFGISYNSMLKILENTTGIIITVVSSFLTLNLDIVKKNEEKSYGLLKTESQVKVGQKIICCIAPVFMVIFLNLSFCTSAYILIIYCYCSMIYDFFMFEKMIQIEYVCKNVAINLLIGISPENRPEEANLDEYKMKLENVGNSIEESMCWQEAKLIYKQFVFQTGRFDIKTRFELNINFYKIVFWNRYRKNDIQAVYMLKENIKYIMKIPSDGFLFEYPDELWLDLLPMLMLAIRETGEDELVEFFQWYIDYENQYNLPYYRVAAVSGMILVFSELRIRVCKSLGKEKMVEQLRNLWGDRDIVFYDENKMFLYWVKMAKSIKEEYVTGLLNCIMDLQADYKNGSHRAVLSMLYL